MLLYELFNDVTIDCILSNGPQHSRFKMAAIVNDQRFEGTGKRTYYYSIQNVSVCVTKIYFASGPSKKMAKNAAAKAALAALCDISYSPMQAKATVDDLPVSNDKKQSYELSQTFADAIGK